MTDAKALATRTCDAGTIPVVGIWGRWLLVAMLCTFARASGNRELGRVGGEEETLNIQL